MFARSASRIVFRQCYSIANITGAGRLSLKHQHAFVVGRGGPPLWRQYHQQKNTVTTEVSYIRFMWKALFGKYLLTTNIVSSGVLMVIGDIAAQEIEYRHGILGTERYDMKRIARMFIVGALQGPLHHYMYKWMDKIMPVANFRNTVKKILIDEIVMSPLCIFIFFYSACYLENKTFKETNHELAGKFGYIYLMDWILWPGAQYINFRYLDTKYRVMFVNVCTAAYNVLLSYMKHGFDVENPLKFFEAAEN